MKRSGKYTAVTQLAECSTFNRLVRGSTPLSGITEGDTAHGAKNKTNVGFSNATAFMVRLFVRLIQLAEYSSYERKVESSILSVNIWSSLWSEVRCSVGGYHVGFSLPKLGFESRHRNQEGLARGAIKVSIAQTVVACDC